jgi:hypothetical protein
VAKRGDGANVGGAPKIHLPTLLLP